MEVKSENWENSYRLNPSEDEIFCPSKVEQVIQQVLSSYLADKVYDPVAAKTWALEISDLIKDQCKNLNMPRYKIAVQTVLSQNGGQGIRVSSKSLWDVQNDNWASSSYANATLFAVGMVFGCYFE